MARDLQLRYVVITSVNRDDLDDGGSRHFAHTVQEVRRALPEARVEVLTPDFRGDLDAVARVLDAAPDVFNHNVETVPRLYRTVRPQANYHQSLEVLRFAKLSRRPACLRARFGAERGIDNFRTEPRASASGPGSFSATASACSAGIRAGAGQLTKSGAMLGLGETAAEVRALLRDLREANVDVVTLGQYLQPTRRNLRVAEYVTPAQFEAYREYGLALGFKMVFSGPLVRSSYMAEMVSEQAARL